MKNKFSFKVLALLLLVISLFTLTFKLLSLPPGLETDEASIAYNASLISKTLRDQNGRFLPFFILSSDHMDWKQPVLIYLCTFLFKIFGSSYLILKIANILIVFLSLFLIFFICKLLFNDSKIALLGVFFTISIPIIIVASRISNESIQPLFFSSLWLLFLILYRKYKQRKYLFLSALSLGIDMYCFKGMRIIVPVWTSFSLLYLFSESLNARSILKLFQERKSSSANLPKLFILIKKSFLDQNFLKNLLAFLVGILPFFLVMPLFEWKYPGSVFDRQSIPLESYRFFIHYWLSNLNLTFLFTEAETAQSYKTLTYGPFLIASLPFFITGLIKSLRKIDFIFFVLICFLATPALFGVAKSTGYVHRLICLIPLFIIILIQGFLEIKKYILKNINHGALKKTFSIILGIFLVAFYFINYLDFISFYYFTYPKQESTKNSFGMKDNHAFQVLSQESKRRNLTPYVQDDIYNRGADASKFFNVAYFNQQLKQWKLGQQLSNGSILLTELEKIDGYQNINAPVKPLNILLKN